MLILASKSPRRKDLLEQKGLKFSIVPSEFDETSITIESPQTYVKKLAYLKARSVLEKHPNDLILGADTIVVYNQEILGKPKDEQDAFLMLKKLVGQKHHVYTAVSLVNREKDVRWLSYAEVTFKHVSDEDLLNYVKTKEPMDKAGAYGIQGIGSFLVLSYYGNYHTIMGLPIDEVMERLPLFEQKSIY